ncbi:methylated-DNA--[protein]-cysteine S-methyltransferase [Haloprofundus sp. MHR1]|uniref:methylated-DNA--[protein]-cysteine S-methyltransferase n=1 Tax=Haloprofundus sp. MHR1 TaxID=2572921 RepID=UPI0010BE24D8|nr:methylated-DNA--[protein]-cysteine S-methyltransferase [Haloprofundus sp. MHR1]QCJ47846.1 methylated-DNA--[protein]-cysteine S-methyltransferase [Haloprofundus sp. MHR1]
MDVELFGTTVALDEAVVSVLPDELRRQIAAYESGERRTFDLELQQPAGFTGAVMEAMAEIPYGETRTYGQLAAKLDTAAVAVGGACGRNPLPIVVPCHRVVGADSLGGYSAGGEQGLRLKHRLLDHERANE